MTRPTTPTGAEDKLDGRTSARFLAGHPQDTLGAVRPFTWPLKRSDDSPHDGALCHRSR
jgi:hypothetical protein